MRKMTAISVFSGAMGLDIGVEKAGFNVKVAVEINKNACEAIKLNRPDVRLFQEDVTNITGEELLSAAGLRNGELDLLVGGPPCQSFSMAGKRKSLTDTKGDCIFQYIRLIEELNPKTFIMENVRGILSSKVQLDGLEIVNDDGKMEIIDNEYPVAQYILKRMEELGYRVEHRLLNSADYGTPQKRYRVFFIGTRLEGELNFPSETHSKNGENNLKKWVTFNDVIKYLKNENIESTTYTPYNEKRRKFMEMVPIGGGNWRDLQPEIAEQAMGKAYTSGGGRVGFCRRIKLNEPTPTLLTSPSHNSTMLGHPIENRPLSVEEYKAIQQFPLDWKLPSSIASQYMVIGNAVPTGLAYEVANAVAKHIKNN
ncbi:DNA cytosine methyltransferase [Anaerorhabdus sp.]|uniref:DNA cytosine methyltransferase n=1 Tax=Anaerorhabdus sp. TaxID=1872524 RepID=UPI002FC5B87C